MLKGKLDTKNNNNSYKEKIYNSVFILESHMVECSMVSIIHKYYRI